MRDVGARRSKREGLTLLASRGNDQGRAGGKVELDGRATPERLRRVEMVEVIAYDLRVNAQDRSVPFRHRVVWLHEEERFRLARAPRTGKVF